MPPSIYLDGHATTPVDPRVLEGMLPFFTEIFGNPSSHGHRHGWRAAEAVEEARRRVAAAVGARPREIVFTGGATESVNLAIQGVVAARRPERDHLVTAATEHKAVLDTVTAMTARGCRVTVLGVDERGRVDPDALAEVVDHRTLLVSVMLANNEIGTVQPIAEIADRCRAVGALLHCDATQAVSWNGFDVASHPVDLASFSSHKIYGPKGAGALYVRRRSGVELAPRFHGGGQEGGLRPGTHDVPALVGFGHACALCRAEGDAEAARLRVLTERLHDRLVTAVGGVHRHGDPVARHPGNLHLAFDGVTSEALLGKLPDLSFSAGSACTSGGAAPSHVLTALGLSAERSAGAVRFGLTRFTTEAEVDRAASRLAEAVLHLRRTHPAR